MRLAGALLRSAFLFAIPVVLVVLLWSPVAALFRAGPLQLLLGLFLSLVVAVALFRGAASMAIDILSGRYDDARALELETEDAKRIRVQHSPGGRWVDVGLFAVSSLVTVLLLEAAFRLFFPQPMYAIRYTSWGWWHESNVCITHGAEASHEGKVLRGEEFVTRLCYNAVGMRDIDRPLVKAPSTKRVVMLGDSYGEAIEVQFADTSAQVLERLLNRDIDAVATGRRELPSAPLAPVRAYDDLMDPITQGVWRALKREADALGAAVLAVSPHFRGENYDRRARFLAESGIAMMDVSDDDREAYHFRFDGHWNVRGNERAATLMAREIIANGLLAGGDVRKVEVLNSSMSAYSTCKQLRVFQEVAKAFGPDLVIVMYTGSESRNLADADICTSDGTGGITVHERTYSNGQQAARAIRSWIKTNSHFLTWLSDLFDRLPLFTEIRARLMQGQETVPFVEQHGGGPP